MQVEKFCETAAISIFYHCLLSTSSAVWNVTCIYLLFLLLSIFVMQVKHLEAMDDIPSIKKCCWRPTKIGDEDWLVKSLFSDDFYEVMFSNQATVWHERLQSSEIEIREKVC
jgi:hypothetical protein